MKETIDSHMIKEPAKGRKKNPAHNKPWQTSSGVYFNQQHSLDLAKAVSFHQHPLSRG